MAAGRRGDTKGSEDSVSRMLRLVRGSSRLPCRRASARRRCTTRRRRARTSGCSEQEMAARSATIERAQAMPGCVAAAARVALRGPRDEPTEGRGEPARGKVESAVAAGARA